MIPDSLRKYVYYEEPDIVLLHGDCLDMLPHFEPNSIDMVLTDPPYNVGYHYESYKDDLEQSQYLKLICESTKGKSILIHYPEDSFHIAIAKQEAPQKCVAWVYNAHTPRKWRLISWFGMTPDFAKDTQPFKNMEDKRIQKKLNNGVDGAKLYDWWEIQQVKNVSEEKTEHPCQIPVNLKHRIIKITEGDTILDPFLGSGTTAVACKQLGRKCIGIELEAKYLNIAIERLRQEVLF
jgi:site-specific DNA-methyltransferase (adenine-specific)